MLTKHAEIAMIGAGAIGGITASFMKQAGWNLELVCKHKDLAEIITNQGIHITGIKGDHRTQLKAVADISELSEAKDLVFIATKATDCVAVARDLLPFLKPDSTVVSLQNGICEPALAQVLGKERVIGCVVGWGASHNGPADLEVTSGGEFVIGNFDHTPDDRLDPIQQILNAVYPTRISNNIMGELYSKLIINSCINSLGVIGGVKLSQLLANKKVRKLFIELMYEAMAVAAAMGITVEPAGAGKLNFYKLLDGKTWLADFNRHLTIRIIGLKYRRIKSSSLQSIERGRRNEIEFLNGYICDCGREQSVPTPVNDAVREMVREIEDGKRQMSLRNIEGSVFERIK
jgi:2-dehydropantoate 2-reductase